MTDLPTWLLAAALRKLFVFRPNPSLKRELGDVVAILGQPRLRLKDAGTYQCQLLAQPDVLGFQLGKVLPVSMRPNCGCSASPHGLLPMSMQTGDESLYGSRSCRLRITKERNVNTARMAATAHPTTTRGIGKSVPAGVLLKTMIGVITTTQYMSMYASRQRWLR